MPNVRRASAASMRSRSEIARSHGVCSTAYKDCRRPDHRRSDWVGLGPVGKVDSKISRSMIQDCLLGGGFGTRRPDRCGVADDIRTPASGAWPEIPSVVRQSTVSQWDAACSARRLPMAGHARTIWQVEFCLCALSSMGGTRRVDALLETLVKLGLADDWRHMVNSTTVRGHSQAAGAKGGLIRKLLVDHAAVLRQKSTPARTVRDVLLALS
jgi:hypothetical protein